MEHFTAHRLRFECEVVTPLRLNEHTGSAIRGAFYHALWNQFCMNHDARACPACPLVATCPVAFLVSTLDPNADRGANVPRPYTVQPPLANPLLPPAPSLSQAWEREGVRGWARAKTDYSPGDTLTFGLTMYARALNLFPYVVLAIQRLERGGIGKRASDNGHRRGTFRVRQVWAENPLTGERREVMRQGETMVQVPDVPITNEQISHFKSQISNYNRVTIELLTPMRLVDNKELVKRMAFRPLIQRLHGRLKQLTAEYSDTPLDFDLRQVMAQAEAVQVIDDETRWVELESYSTRLGRATPIGGLAGRVTFEGDLAPFWQWLVWGQFTHVGKDTVKGNGWYRILQGGEDAQRAGIDR
jgi:hypothetical protein